MDFPFFRKKSPSAPTKPSATQTKPPPARTLTEELARLHGSAAPTKNTPKAAAVEKVDQKPATKPHAVSPAPRTAAAPTAQPKATTELVRETEKLDFTEASAETCSVIEEAAIFYANERNAEAIAVLTHYLQEHPEQPDLQPWLMLFDLFQSQGMKEEFDKYALQYVVRFERSSPAWVDTNNQQDSSVPAPKPSGGDYVSLGGQVTAANIEPKLKRLREFAQNSPVRLDFAKLEAMDQPACQQLIEELERVKKAGKKIRCINTPPLVKILKTEVGKTPDEAHESYWLLLFYLYQALGLQAEFEDLAVEYAVAYEVSPPSWEDVTEPITLQESADTPAEAVDADDMFSLSGVITTGVSDNQMADLMKFAEDKMEFSIDMSRVSRVDFMSVGNFLTTLMQFSQAGKKVAITGANEMVQGLFSAMGVNQFANVIRKTK